MGKFKQYTGCTLSLDFHRPHHLKVIQVCIYYSEEKKHRIPRDLIYSVIPYLLYAATGPNCENAAALLSFSPVCLVNYVSFSKASNATLSFSIPIIINERFRLLIWEYSSVLECFASLACERICFPFPVTKQNK